MIGLGAILWTSPWMLLGVAAVAGPLVAHWLRRRWRRRLSFPMVTIMAEAMADRSSLYRARRRVLLWLRCAAVVLIAAAFARPNWLVGPYATAAQAEGRSTVLLIDVSGSMKRRRGAATNLHRAVAEGRRVLKALNPSRDRANVIYVASSPKDLHGRPVAPARLLGPLGGLLEDSAGQPVRPTDAPANWPEAVAEAVRQIESTGPDGRIVLISDFLNGPPADLASSVPERIGLRFIDVVNEQPDNSSVRRPRAFPETPTVGRPVRLSVMVHHDGSAAVARTVRVLVADRPVGVQTLRLAPGESRWVDFEHRFERTGPHAVRFELDGGDGLAEDNVARAVVHPVAGQKVALLSDRDPADPDAGAYYLHRALAPQGDSARLNVVSLRPSQLPGAELETIPVVLIASTGAWSEAMLNRLVNFAAAGGSILWFWSDPQAPANAAMWNRHPDVRQKIPLPSGPTDPRAGPTGLVLADPAPSPLDLFEQAGRDRLRQVRIVRRFGTLGRSDPDDLLRFDRGGAALTVRRVGRGRMALAPFGLDPAGNTLGREASVFVPLLHAMVDAWSTPARPIACRPGQQVTVEHESKNPRWRLVGPNGSLNHRVRQFADRYRLSFEAPQQAGFVDLFDGSERVDRIAVNFDPSESNPNRSPVPQNRSAAAGGFGGGGEEPFEGTPLWPWLVVAALGVLGLEMALLGVWSR